MLKDDTGHITTSGAGSTKFNILHSSHWAVLLAFEILKSSMLSPIGNMLLSVYCYIWNISAKEEEIDEAEVAKACF